MRYRLPVYYSTQIGRIITRWAYLEWRLHETAYLLLKIGPKEGRLAVRAPRVADYVTMLQDIARVKSVTVTENWKDLKNLLVEAESYRNRLAHGVWMKCPGTKNPVIRDLSGAYVQGVVIVEKARINPLAVEVKPSDLRNIITAIHALTQRIERLHAEIRTQQ